jgi:hypothetical protein
MRIPRIWPDHAPAFKVNSHRPPDLVHAADQRGSLFGRLVFKSLIDEVGFWHAVSVRIVVEVVGPPGDGDGVVAAAGVGFAVEAYGTV